MVLRKNQRLFVIGIGLAAQLLACTPQNQNVSTATEAGPSTGIFSNRQIGSLQDVFIITFVNPPLAASAKKVDGKLVIDEAAKAKLLAEQNFFETKLKAIAPDSVVIYRYRMLLNAMAVMTTSDIGSQLMNLPGVSGIHATTKIARAEDLHVTDILPPPSKVNSVSFIGGGEAHAQGYSGQGTRVGIIDTGIDYTHSMLGGSGKAAGYAAINPSLPNAAFPNEKVVGGIDLVGSDFNSASTEIAAHIPHPDANPLDEAGHGTHVAGTIAGRGDGVKTYDGVAPEAKLYAIKVFGKEGSTADAAIIAGLEYAADPDQTMNPNNHLDVVNLSLGSTYGQPQTLYSAAVKNLTDVGTVVVVSAGNEGPKDYIVGTPSTSDDAISVAASIDGSLINWKFAAALFKASDNTTTLAKEVEGPITKPVSQVGNLTGELVDIGMAEHDLSDDLKAKVRGKVAFAQRGIVGFQVKIQRAFDAGAIGVVVYNNDSSPLGPMGGDPTKPISIPAFIITQALGQQLLANMKTGPVTVEFNNKIIEEPQNIDTITDFSSKGPRSEDSLIKPEVAAPGQNITSAAMGKGSDGVMMDGTSMAAPHLSGVLALFKQAHQGLSAAEFKSLVMNTSKILPQIPITLQGAGRVQIVEGLKADVVSENPSLSLGRVELAKVKVETRDVTLHNFSDNAQTLSISTTTSPGMTIDVPASVTVPAHGKAKVQAKFTFNLVPEQAVVFELDGRLIFKDGEQVKLQIPAMAIRMQASMIQGSAGSGSGAVTLSNSSPNQGLALAFNLLGQDPPKSMPGPNEAWKNRDCDLHTAGYRILRKTTQSGTQDVIQFAFQLYTPVTTWDRCSVSVLIDSKGTGVPDQEIAGVLGDLEGVIKAKSASVLLDASRARAIRFSFEQQLNNGIKEAKVDYTGAVQSYGALTEYNQSTLAIIEAPVNKLNLTRDGKLNIKLASQAETNNGDTYQSDKYLGSGVGTWMRISPRPEDQAYITTTENTKVGPQGGSLELNRGAGTQPLVLFYPLNTISLNNTDTQVQVLN